MGRRLAGAPRIDHGLIAEVLSAPVTLDDVVPWIRFEGDRYVRVAVLTDERFEIRLLCWAPGQSSALHAHGDAWCGLRVLTGEATETRLGRPERLLQPGTVTTIRGGQVHQVANRGSTALITLHVYSPPLPVDAPSGPNGRRIVVIGAGPGGSALAVQLLASGRPELRITLVERGTTAGESEQVALADAVRSQPGRLRIHRASAVEIRGPEGRRAVLLSDGTELPADDVVLAIGHAPGRVPEAESLGDDAWLQGIPTDPDGRVIGPGGDPTPDLWVIGGARRVLAPERAAEARELAALLAERADLRVSGAGISDRLWP